MRRVARLALENRHFLRVGGARIAIAVAVGGLFAPVAANAQSAADPAASQPSGTQGLQDIIVTAQKREEKLQNVPVAVSAFNQAAISDHQIGRFQDLSGLAPNVTTLAATSGSSPTVTIRGIVGSNVEIGKDSGVALYLDGVYISRTTGAGFEVADLDRVEVLRGPQGILYGRNATGGAVNYITSEPKDDFYGRQEVTVGSLGELRLKTRIDSGKIGAFSISVNYLHDQRAGWIRNSFGGLTYNFSDATAAGPVGVGTQTSSSRLGGKNTEGGMVAVRYAPDSLPVTVDYKFDITRSVYQAQAQQVLLDESGLGGLRNAPVTFAQQDAVPMGFTTPEHLKTFGHNLTATADLSDSVKFKSITGYRGYSTEFSDDVIGGGFEKSVLAPNGTYSVLGIIDTERERTFSEEGQFTYTSKLFDATAGAYYFHQHTKTYNPLYFFQAIPTAQSGSVPVSLAPTLGNIHNESVAGYGQATVHITDQLDVTGGARYSTDDRQSSIPTAFNAHFKHWDWTGNATYRPTRNITLYAKAGTGYISGGINTNAPIPYKPERLLQYEIGAKTEWFGNRLRINLAAFDSKYDDLQLSVNDPVTGLFITGNAGKAKIQGFEAEITAIPVQHLTLSANYGYTHFKYKEYILNGQDVTDIAYPTFYRPKNTLSMNGQYDFPELPSGAKPSFSLSTRWHSNMRFYVLPAAFQYAGVAPLYNAAETAAFDKFASHNAIWDVDARVSLADVPMGANKGKFSLWVRNLLDKRTLTNATSVAAFGVAAGQFHEPRTYGADFSFEF